MDSNDGLELDPLLAGMSGCTDRAREKLGAGHPVVQLFECVDESFASLRELRRQYDECRGAAEREALRRRILADVAEVARLWEHTMALASRLDAGAFGGRP